MKIRTEPVRGMRDLLPPESEEMLWLQERFADIALSYGYRYVITPTIELFQLFAVKSGPEISRSMYVFRDKAGREVCLRPELTASVARIYLRKLMSQPKPIKLFYIGQAFRYEEPQQGRFREFYQAGIEYIGDSGTHTDIELLLLLRDYYSAVGLSEYRVKMSTMRVYRELFRGWGVPEDVQDLIIHYLDKKMVDEAFKELSRFERADTSIIESLSTLVTNDPERITSFGEELGLKPELREELGRLATILDVSLKAGVKEPYVDLGFARGLAYYTGFIFEVLTPHLSFSITGGGRYDTLISLYGGPETPSTGFALGIDRLRLSLSKAGWKLPEARERVLIAALTDNYTYVDKVARRLRELGLVADARYGKKVGDLLSYASRAGYDYAAIVGGKEVEEGSVTLKNLHTRTQRKVYMEMLEVGELP